jgi:DNA modification methylase
MNKSIEQKTVAKKPYLKMDTSHCPVCSVKCGKTFLPHLKKEHPEKWSDWRKDFVKMREEGIPLEQIGKKYGISWTVIEREIKRMLEEKGKTLRLKKKKIKSWEPKDFRLEANTVWSFPNRGSWATHKGDYRGNWSPYIPRNVILRYSKEGETVLDQFVGAGTTLTETKLLGRKGIGIDINPNAIELARQRLDFEKEGALEQEIRVGDARDLVGIEDESIDLICTHPPYANIIQYSDNVKDDLSHRDIDEFIEEMRKVAKESLRVLKKDRYCVILIGDTRRKKHMIPIGFRVMQVFLDAGFVLKEIVIKEQHNCKTTGFWYKNSIKYNFLLMAHEYLFVFRKPKQKESKR